MRDNKRNSGRTTEQIINAPKNALYLCPYFSIPYNRRIAYEHNRHDITFISSNLFNQEKLRGRLQYVIIDHSIIPGRNCSMENYDYINFHNKIVKSKEKNRNDKIRKN